MPRLRASAQLPLWMPSSIMIPDPRPFEFSKRPETNAARLFAAVRFWLPSVPDSGTRLPSYDHTPLRFFFGDADLSRTSDQVHLLSGWPLGEFTDRQVARLA